MCIDGATGKIVRDAKARNERETVVEFFQGGGLPLARIGLEAGPLSH